MLQAKLLNPAEGTHGGNRTVDSVSRVPDLDLLVIDGFEIKVEQIA
jgi:hypothetical protein